MLMPFNENKKGDVIFHPQFFHTGFFTGTPDVIADAMGLVSALVVEQ